jgi:hypothetical protein
MAEWRQSLSWELSTAITLRLQQMELEHHQ